MYEVTMIVGVENIYTLERGQLSSCQNAKGFHVRGTCITTICILSTVDCKNTLVIHGMASSQMEESEKA
jgi:hypothetical protein